MPQLNRARVAIVLACAALSPAAARAQNQTITLPSATPAVPKVSVVGSITGVTDAGRTVQVITRAEIDQSTARNVAELLAMRAGVDVYGRSPAQADLSLRGGTAEQTLILVDGVRVSDTQSGDYSLDLAVPLVAIERIEILKGAASALYGSDAVGGVVNIVTRAAYNGADLAGHGGAWGTRGVSALLGGTFGGWNASPSFEYERSDGWRPGTDHRIGQARFSLLRSKGFELIQMHLATALRDFGANDFYQAYNSYERTTSSTADIKWRSLLGEWLWTTTASTRFHTDRLALVRDEPPLYDNEHRTSQSEGSLVARRTTDAGAVAFAVDVTNNQFGSTTLNNHHEWRTGAVAQFTAGRDTGSTFDLAMRGDRSTQYGSFFSPSVAFSVPLSAFTRFRASVSRGLRTPVWTEEVSGELASPPLASELSWSGEAGLHIADAGDVLDVAYFRRRAVHVIDWVRPASFPASIPWRAADVGTADYHGYEASFALAPEGGATYTFAMMQLSFADDESAALTGNHALRPIVRQYSTKMHWLATDNSTVAVEMIRANRFGEDTFLTANARITYSTDPAWDLTIDATNLGNATWLDASGQVVAGRSVYAGLRWHRP